MRRPLITVICLLALALLTYGKLYRTDIDKPETFVLQKIFSTNSDPLVDFGNRIMANPLLYVGLNQSAIIIPAANGTLTALDPDSGEMMFEIKLATPIGQSAQLVATPVIIGDKLVVSYQCLDQGVRSSHRLVVIDLALKTFDARFPELIVTAEQASSDKTGMVKFNPSHAFSHAALTHLPRPNSALGYVYAAFGNAGDNQPYHGWVFEIDLDAWKNQGSDHAIRNVLLTTPEADCPVTMKYGTQEMICGGGIWAPTGPQLFADDKTGEPELLIPTGNGQIDLKRRDYANTLMRVKPGLQFDAECDEALCANFDPKQPDEACIASCKNLFIPRLAAGNKPLKPANGECDNKTFWECLAWLDYDLGASSPVKATLKNGQSVLVQPGKDGGVYLIDASHIGTQYDRISIAETCGTASDPCPASWMGMIVTQPRVTYLDGQAVIIVATFNPDKSHPAGLVALKILENSGQPKFQRLWHYPDPNAPESLLAFRSHPSLPILSYLGNTKEAVAWVVDIGEPGTLYGIRIKDGEQVAKQILQGTGQALSAPLLYNNTLYLASISSDTDKAMLEAYRIYIMD